MMEATIRRDLHSRPFEGESLVIFLGDYIDRGPDSRDVINVLCRRRFAGLPTRFLLGNHEDAMLRFMEDSKIGPAWLSHGGMATLASYGAKPTGPDQGERLEQMRLGLIEAVPASHKDFLESLELWVQLGDFLFVHAGVRPGRDLVAQRREDLLTIRDAFFAAKTLPWRVVHGHTVVSEPQLTPTRISLDTGAYATGRLTCGVIEGEQVDLLTT